MLLFLLGFILGAAFMVSLWVGLYLFATWETDKAEMRAV